MILLNYTKMKICLILFGSIFLLLSSCTNDLENTNIIDSIKINIDDTSATIINESQKPELVVTDTVVLFFTPSTERKRELMKFYGAYNQYTFNMIYTDFSVLYNNVKNALRPYKIPVELSQSKKFVFIIDNDSLIYDLDIEGQFIGYILADGVNFPVIRNGVQHTKDVSNDIRNYFNIANFSIYTIEEDTVNIVIEPDGS